jgi:hypothetical protein
MGRSERTTLRTLREGKEKIKNSRVLYGRKQKNAQKSDLNLEERFLWDPKVIV